MSRSSRSVGLVIAAVAIAGGSVIFAMFWPPATPPGGEDRIDNDSLVTQERDDGLAVLLTRAGDPGWVELAKPFPDLPPAGPASDHPFLGAEACAECHQEKVDSFIQTAHHKTSTLPSEQSILGNFDAGHNVLETSNPHLTFEMTREPDGYYQQVSYHSFQQKFRFDLVTGSGKMGQTYLYWLGDQLFQLHVTYFTEGDRWTNSPGYLDGTAMYSRPALTGCLACHATYFEARPGVPNRFDPTNFVLGISCERCHGPGRDHVEYHRKNADAAARHIVNPSSLPPERLNDVCSQCHSGTGKPLRPYFTMQPGDRLADFIQITMDASKVAGGVHTDNQLARLRASKCFLGSESVTCVDCHNPHQQERGNLALFSKRCLKCHEVDHCGKAADVGETIADNCIDCHMPKRRDQEMRLETNTGVQFPMLRDHLIRVDREATERVMQDRR